MTHYVYIIECKDNSLYTGYTNSIIQRIEKHKNKKGAKYTTAKGFKELKYFETHKTKEEAMKREYHIKQQPRAYKQELINNFQKLLK